MTSRSPSDRDDVDAASPSPEPVRRDLTDHATLLVERCDELIAMATPNGRLLYLNRSGRELLGLSADAPLPSVKEFLDSEDRPRLDADIVPCLREGRRWTGEMRLNAGPARSVTVLWSAFVVDEANDEHDLIWAFTARDMTRTKRIETALSERDQQYRALLNGVRDYAIFTIGVDGRIKTWSEGAALMKGYSAEEAIGMRFASLFPSDEREAGRPEMEMAVAAATGEYAGEGKRRRKDGSYFDAFVVLTAMHSPDGELMGYLKLTQDISQRKRQERDREELLRSTQAARSDAERANKMKNEFLATISHELRTPLGAILGWSRLLERGQHDADGLRLGLAAISRNASIQSQLIDDLLDMGRIESGTLRLEQSPVDVAMVVTAGIDATEPAAKAKGIQVRTQIDPATPPVMADFGRLRQIVWNLLSNSIKFTPEGGTVVVSARPSNLGAEVSVTDTGQGIAPNFLPHVFDRFRQHDSSSTRRQGGLGLGLSIVKQLVDLHGGQVGVQSAGEGCGSTFRIDLPAAAAAGWAGRGTPLPAPVGSWTSARPAALRGLKVLIVDDEPDARQVARQVLERAGASVVEAGNALDALDAVKRHHPDALLSDIGMPVHDGYELISWVRALNEREGGQVPAAAVTAYSSSDDRDRALRSGFQVHVAKPVDVDLWVTTVEHLVEDASHRHG